MKKIAGNRTDILSRSYPHEWAVNGSGRVIVASCLCALVWRCRVVIQAVVRSVVNQLTSHLALRAFVHALGLACCNAVVARSGSWMQNAQRLFDSRSRTRLLYLCQSDGWNGGYTELTEDEHRAQRAVRERIE
jgi:hypothetical protein